MEFLWIFQLTLLKKEQLYSISISATIWVGLICFRCDRLAGPCMSLCMVKYTKITQGKTGYPQTNNHNKKHNQIRPP